MKKDPFHFLATKDAAPDVAHSPQLKISSIKPIDNQVLIQPDAAETKTAGGIIIPDTAKLKSNSGTVVAVGPTATQVKVNDKVFYPLYGITDFNIEGQPYIIIREPSIHFVA